MFTQQEMMYIWNGYTVIGKHKDLTEGILETLNEAQQRIEQQPSNVLYSTEKIINNTDTLHVSRLAYFLSLPSLRE